MMEFNRPPRIQKPLLISEVIIPAPNNIPSKPTINWLVTLMPILGIGLVIILMSSFSTSSSSFSYFIYLPLMGVSVVASIITYFQQKNRFKKSIETEKEKYYQLLADKKKHLARLIEEQEEILHFRDPSPETCTKWPITHFHRLGERRPNDWDFLSFRIGEGSIQSQVNVQLPEEKTDLVQFHDLYKRAIAISDEYTYLNNVPICINLRNIGLLGIAGKTQSNHLLVKSIILQLTSHHWPTEMNILIITEKMNFVNWSWIKDIPHRTNLYPSPIVSLTGWSETDFEISNILERELLTRQEIVAENEEKIEKLPALIVIFDNVPKLYEHAAFSRLLAFGPSLKIYGIFLSKGFTNLPAECCAYLEEVSSDQTLVYKETGETAISITNINPDRIKDDLLQSYIKALSEIEWLIPDLVTEPPSENFGLLDLFPSKNLDEIPIKEYWSSEGKGNFTYLKTPIGKLNRTTPLFLDLNDGDNAHGPHGIIGGMTGSGKSVLIKTLLLSFAMTHHPYDLNFALIDYKGGGDFLELLSLPHVVGFITDIENHEDYAHRVIEALSGELQKREHIIQQAQKNFNLKRAHIDDYRNHVGAKTPMSRLVIIFDEFAEFKERHKEESKQLISIARRGRSLGVHLILCTQNPQAAIDEAVKQNARFTISLKVNSVGDSKNLLGISDAWGLPIGEAFLKVRAPQKFKIAYPKMPYMNETIDETQAILNKINDVYKDTNLDKSPPAQVWPSPLPDNLFLPDLLPEKEQLMPIPELLKVGFPIGLLDNPHKQIQPIYHMGGRSQAKNLIVFGGPNSGKSTFLITVAMSLAQLTSPKNVHIYGLDLCKQKTLNMLLNLPHVAEFGGIISGDENEKINRFFSLMRTEISERISHFTSYEEYIQNGQNDDQKYPLIFILVDGMTKTYLDEHSSIEPQMLEIVRDGQRVGIYLIITTNSKTDIRKIDNLIQHQLIISPKDKRQISDIISYPIGHFGQMEIERLFPPGRGIFNEQPILAFQTALPLKYSTDSSISSHIFSVIEKIYNRFPCHEPTNVIELPIHLSYEKVESYSLDNETVIPLGVLQETFSPLNFSPEDFIGFWIASTFPKLGKTSFLINLILSFAEVFSPKQLSFIFIDFHSRSLTKLSNLPHNIAFVRKPDEMEDVIEILQSEIDKRNAVLFNKQSNDEDNNKNDRLKAFSDIIVIIDDLRLLINKDPDNKIDKIISLFFQSEDLKIKWIFTGNVGEFTSSDRIIKRVAQLGTGVLLGGSEGLERFGTGVPYGQKLINLPAGRGYFILRGNPQIFQAATYWHSNPDIDIKYRVDHIQKKFFSVQDEIPKEQMDPGIAIRLDTAEETSQEVIVPPIIDDTQLAIQKIKWDTNFSITQLFNAYNIIPQWNGLEWIGKDNCLHMDPIIGWVNTNIPGLEKYESENPVRICKNTLITGISGSGKSWLLKIYALSLAILNTPNNAQVFYLDSGGRESFAPLVNLPHVRDGGINISTNPKQVDQWYKSLQNEQNQRLSLFRDNKVADFDQYQCLDTNPLPQIHVLIDNWPRNNPDCEKLQKLVEQARTCGMRFILTTQNPDYIPSSIRENFYNRIVLQTSEKTELLKSLETTDYIIEFLSPWRNFAAGEGYIHTWLILKLKVAFPSIADTLPDALANQKQQSQERDKLFMDEQNKLSDLVALMKKTWNK
jgi:DNA segregation ATPase FtsK/SpoIIIE, S-DNA-T family